MKPKNMENIDIEDQLYKKSIIMAEKVLIPLERYFTNGRIQFKKSHKIKVNYQQQFIECTEKDRTSGCPWKWNIVSGSNDDMWSIGHLVSTSDWAKFNFIIPCHPVG